ncbi:hypothetical protein LTR56_003770 [Elasticomyces elasticus]|nr:hypothetical protein LTR22_013170 [Elasticomyces elasticus]KAK3654912.1 hypothetical protein LTR56_003770 [Elasticomyces elasticus]KAK4928758.1 hypothetical protein LTR49_004567 [Elasticomyces elasticus]
MITYTLDSRRHFPPSLHGCDRPEFNATGKRECSPECDAASNKRRAVSNASCDGDDSYVGNEKVEAWRLSTDDNGQNPRPETTIRMRLASSQKQPVGGMDAVPQRSDHDAANSHYKQPRHTPETLVIPPYSAMTFSSAEIFKEVCGHIPTFTRVDSQGRNVGKNSACNFCFRHSLCCNPSRSQCENSVAFGQPCVRLLCEKNLFRALCWKPECIRVHFEDILEWFSKWEPEWSGLLLFTNGDILSRGETNRDVRPRNRLGVIPDGLQSAFVEGSNYRRQAIKLMREHCGIQKRWSTSERLFLFWDWAGIDSKAKWLSAFNEFLTWARPLLDETFAKYERMRDSGQTSGARIDWRVEEWRWAYEIIIEPDGPPAESRKAQPKELKGLGPKGLLALEQKDRTVARGQRGLTESGKGSGRSVGKPSAAKVTGAPLKAVGSLSRRSSRNGVDDGTLKAGVATDAKGGPSSEQTFTIANPPKGPRGWHAS